MSTSEIVALISSIFTAISGISAAVACILTYRTTRPKIKLIPHKSQIGHIYSYWKEKSFALLSFQLINSSMIDGMIDDLCIVYNGKEYFAENIFTNYDPQPFELEILFDGVLKQNTDALRLKTPLTVKAYSTVNGFIFFPTFPAVQLNSINVTITYRVMNKKFKRKIRRVKFYLVSPEPIYDGKQ